jgi:hypothetical protein
MTTFRKADDLDGLVLEVMHKYHGPLESAGMTVQILYAYPARDANGEATAPALRVGGYPALTSVQIMTHKRRAAGAADIEITLDWDNWSVSSVAEQRALLDHDFTHIELQTDSNGNVKRHEDGRPLLRIRKHDQQFGWFDVVAFRHKEASTEVRECREMLDSVEFKQCYLFDCEEKEEQVEAAGTVKDRKRHKGR